MLKIRSDYSYTIVFFADSLPLIVVRYLFWVVGVVLFITYVDFFSSYSPSALHTCTGFFSFFRFCFFFTLSVCCQFSPSLGRKNNNRMKYKKWKKGKPRSENERERMAKCMGEKSVQLISVPSCKKNCAMRSFCCCCWFFLSNQCLRRHRLYTVFYRCFLTQNICLSKCNGILLELCLPAHSQHTIDICSKSTHV